MCKKVPLKYLAYCGLDNQQQTGLEPQIWEGQGQGQDAQQGQGVDTQGQDAQVPAEEDQGAGPGVEEGEYHQDLSPLHPAGDQGALLEYPREDTADDPELNQDQQDYLGDNTDRQ